MSLVHVYDAHPSHTPSLALEHTKTSQRMRIELAPLCGIEDEPCLAVPVSADGIARIDGVDVASSPHDIWPSLFCMDGVVLLDAHGMLVPRHWPFRLWKCLCARTDSACVCVTFTHDPDHGAAVVAAHCDDSEDTVVVHVAGMHLFQTPPYRPLLRWLLGEGNAETFLTDGSRVRRQKDGTLLYRGEKMEWEGWFSLFPVLERDVLTLEVYAADRSTVFAKDVTSFAEEYRMAFRTHRVCDLERQHRSTEDVKTESPPRKKKDTGKRLLSTPMTSTSNRV